jgi:hypothetical protein
LRIPDREIDPELFNIIRMENAINGLTFSYDMVPEQLSEGFAYKPLLILNFGFRKNMNMRKPSLLKLDGIDRGHDFAEDVVFIEVF